MSLQLSRPCSYRKLFRAPRSHTPAHTQSTTPAKSVNVKSVRYQHNHITKSTDHVYTSTHEKHETIFTPYTHHKESTNTDTVDLTHSDGHNTGRDGYHHTEQMDPTHSHTDASTTTSSSSSSSVIRHKPLRTHLREWMRYSIPVVEGKDRVQKLPISNRNTFIQLLQKKWKSEMQHDHNIEPNKKHIDHSIKNEIATLRNALKNHQYQIVINYWQSYINTLPPLSTPPSTSAPPTTTPTTTTATSTLSPSSHVAARSSTLPHGFTTIARLSIHASCMTAKEKDLKLSNAILMLVEKYYTHGGMISSNDLIKCYMEFVNGLIHNNKHKTSLRLIERLNTKFQLYSIELYKPLLQYTAYNVKDMKLLHELMYKILNEKHLKTHALSSTSLLNDMLHYVTHIEKNLEEVLNAEIIKINQSNDQSHDNGDNQSPQHHQHQCPNSSLSSLSSINTVLTAFNKTVFNGTTIHLLLSPTSCTSIEVFDNIMKFIQGHNEIHSAYLQRHLLNNSGVVSEIIRVALYRFNDYTRAISFLQYVHPISGNYELRTAPNKLRKLQELDVAGNEVEKEIIINELRDEMHSSRARIDTSIPHIDSAAYNVIIAWCAKHQQLNAALWLWSLMQVRWMAPNVKAQRQMIVAAGRANSPELYWQLYESALIAHNNIHTKRLWSALAAGAVCFEDSSHLKRLLGLLYFNATKKRSTRDCPPPDTWKQLLRILSRKQRFDELFDIIQGMRNHNIVFDGSLFIGIIDQLNEMKYTERCITQILRFMQVQRLPISDELLTAFHAMRIRCTRRAGIPLDLNNDFVYNGFTSFVREFKLRSDDEMLSGMTPTQVREHVVRQLVNRFNVMVRYENSIEYAIRQLEA